jgi:general secretion pathway protein E
MLSIVKSESNQGKDKEAPMTNMTRVLTSLGGDMHFSEELRSMVAYLEDGRLLVAKTYAFNPHVKGLMARLDMLSKKYVVEHVDLSVIAAYYDEVGPDKDVEHSDMQRMATTLFQRAVKKRASDIHIRVNLKKGTTIYFRVHNDLEFVEDHSGKTGDQLCRTIYQAMADVADSTFEQMSRQDARISDKSKIPTNIDGIRIGTTPQVDGYVMVMRLLYNDTSEDLDLEKLGYQPRQVTAIRYMMKRPTGVIVIAGPTGSGKSTTLQRALGIVIQECMGRKHVITVEDPPEYPIPGAVQTPVINAETEEERSRQYQKAIKAAMRLDPDIIMLSEVRDQPTAKLVIQAAMTGHQVWTTVHANNALAIIDRMRDLGVDPDLLTDPTIVSGLICQRLVKVLCPHCKVELSQKTRDYDAADLTRIMSVVNVASAYVMGRGCNHCNHTGTIGRTVVAETVITDNNLMKFIKAGDRIGALEYISREQRGVSMLDHAICKINAGLIDPFQAEDVVGALNSGIIERDHSVTPEDLRA